MGGADFHDDDKFTLSSSLHQASLGGDEVVLQSETGQYHLWNATGQRVVELLQDGYSIAAVADVISRETDASREVALQDIRTFVGALLDRKLLEHVTTSA